MLAQLKPQLDLGPFAIGAFAKFDRQRMVVRENVFHLGCPEM